MLPAMGEILNIVSSVAKSKHSPATVHPVCFPAALPGGGGRECTPSQYGIGGVQALSQCLSRSPMQHPPKELRSHLGHTLTTLSKSVSDVVSPGILPTFAGRDPKSPDCVVHDDANDVHGEEDETDVTMCAKC